MIRALPAVGPRLALGALTFALAAGAAAAVAQQPEEVDRVVAVIRSPASPEPRVITRSQVEDEVRIALVGRGAPLAAVSPLDRPALEAGLAWTLDQELLDAEANRLQVFEISDDEAQEELARFRAQFTRTVDYQAFLASTELSEAELTAVLRRSLRVRRYVESRSSHAAQVSEAELNAWLDQHAPEIGSRDRDVARAHLARRRVEDEVRALVRDLRARAEVWLLGDLGRGVAPAGEGS